MAIGDVYEIVLRGVNGVGEAVYNVLHMKMTSATPSVPTMIEDVCALLFPTTGSIGVNMLLPTVDYILAEVSYKLIHPSQGPLNVYPLTTPRAGRAGGTGILTAAAVVKWMTALGGRSARGRSYFGPVSEDCYTSGVMPTTQVGYAQAAINALLAIYGATGGTSVDWRMVIWSRILDTAYEVTEGIVRNLAKTQRRRQRGVGA